MYTNRFLFAALDSTNVAEHESALSLKPQASAVSDTDLKCSSSPRVFFSCRCSSISCVAHVFENSHVVCLWMQLGVVLQCVFSLKRTVNENAFQERFLGDTSCTYFLAHLKSMHAVQTRKEYFPFLSVIQSSGWGKTRLMFEFSKRFSVPLLYFCLREV